MIKQTLIRQCQQVVGVKYDDFSEPLLKHLYLYLKAELSFFFLARIEASSDCICQRFGVEHLSSAGFWLRFQPAGLFSFLIIMIIILFVCISFVLDQLLVKIENRLNITTSKKTKQKSAILTM